MTSMEKTTRTRTRLRATAEQAGPAAGRSADFGIDTTAKSTSEAIRAYATKLRGGDLGALPALLGLLALFILFTALASDTFPSLLNLANLLQQGAGQTIIAMGLVFVLLTGEIDLAAGTASGLHGRGDGTAPRVERQPARRDGHHGVRAGRASDWRSPSCWACCCASGRAPCSRRVALLLLVVGFPPNPWLEMLLAVCTARPSASSPASSCPGSACRRSWSPSRCSSRGRA